VSVLGGALVLVGAALTLIAGVGVVRLPDLYARLHASSKATSFGIAFVLAGVAVLMPEPDVAVKISAAILFQFVTVPAAAHTIGRRAHREGLEFGVTIDDLREDRRDAGRGDDV
jgi:multicomponent Na+:H+ antiporter subunit G